MSGPDGAGDLIVCPQCGTAEWRAVEVVHSLTPCWLSARDHQVDVVFDARAEFSREASTSTVTHYLCGNDDCGFMVHPPDIAKLIADV